MHQQVIMYKYNNYILYYNIEKKRIKRFLKLYNILSYNSTELSYQQWRKCSQKKIVKFNI